MSAMETVEGLRPRYEVLAEELRRYVETLDGGSKLPTIRDLMRRFDSSQATVDRSLQALESEFLIKRVSGRGYFKVEDAELERQTRLKIDFCFFLQSSVLSNPLYSVMIESMLKEMDQRNCIMNVFAFDPKGSVEEFRERIKLNRPDALFLLACGRETFSYALKELEIPFIHVYPNMIHDDVLSFLIDNRKAVELVVDRLVSLGHSRIAYLHGQGFLNSHMLDQEERMEGFYESMERHGLGVGGNMVTYGGFTEEEGYAAAKKLLSQSERLRPTAIFGNDYNAPGVYRAAAELGLRIPEDLSVVGFDNLTSAGLMKPKLTSIDIQHGDLVAALAEQAVTMASRKEQLTGIIRTNVELVERGSVTKK